MWAIPIMGSAVLFGAQQYADSRYFSRDEVEKARVEYMTVRQSDLNSIDLRFDKLTVKADAQAGVLGGVKEELAGLRSTIQEQNRLIYMLIDQRNGSLQR